MASVIPVRRTRSTWEMGPAEIHVHAACGMCTYLGWTPLMPSTATLYAPAYREATSWCWIIEACLARVILRRPYRPVRPR